MEDDGTGRVVLRYDYNLDGWYGRIAPWPRMWILKPTDPADRDGLVADLNVRLLSRKRPGPVTFNIELAKMLEEPMQEDPPKPPRRAELRTVQAIYADHVEIYHRDPVKNAQDAEDAGKPLGDVIMGRFGREPTEVDQLKAAEEEEFWVGDVDGPQVLLDSIEAMMKANESTTAAYWDRWSGVGRRASGLGGDDATAGE